MVLEYWVLGGAFVAMLSGVALIAWRSAAEVDQRLWEPAARALVGVCEFPSAIEAMLGGGKCVLTATIGGTQVVVTENRGKYGTTTAVARFAGAQDLVITLVAEAITTSVGKALGVVHDQEVGDALFDARFVVTGNDAALCRAWLTAPLRAGLGAPALKGWEVSISNGAVELERSGPPTNANEVVLVAQHAAALAARANELAQEWEALAVALTGALTTDAPPPFVPIRAQRGNLVLEVAVVRTKGTSTTQVRVVPTPAGDEPLALDLGRLILDPEVVSAALDAVAERAGVSVTPYREA